jgi:hypothetical protein
MAATQRLLADGDSNTAYAAAQRSLTVADEIGVAPSPTQLVWAAATTMSSGHPDEARELARRGADAAELHGDRRGEAFAWMMVSAAERYCGDLAAAADAGRRSEAVARRAGSDDLLAGALLMQGFALRDIEPERALQALDESARLAYTVSRDSSYLMWSVQNAGLIRLRRGDRPGARDGFGAALDICERTGGLEYAATTAGHLALGLLDVGDAEDVGAAVMLLTAAEQLFSPSGLYAGLGTSPNDLGTRVAAVVGADAIAELRARGAALDFDGALALARAALARVTGADGETPDG